MNDKNNRLIYYSLGAFMVVLLQNLVFQEILGFSNIIEGTMEIPYFWYIVFFIFNIVSFIGIIIFIVLYIKLIINNLILKDK